MPDGPLPDPRILRAANNALKLGIDVERYEALLHQLTADSGVAIVGLVSRGKSTLVNDLIGVQLCPVNAKGETVATLTIRSGPFYAQAWDESGREVHTSSDLAAFSKVLLRGHVPLITRASYQAPLRLPDNVTIVDTPGVDDAVGAEEQLAYLERHWMRSGTRGAVVVVSVPPGLAGSDLRLIEQAQSLFGRNLVVAVKPTDSAVSLSDLEDVAALVHHHLGKRPVIVGDTAISHNWGEGRTGDLDRAIEKLTRQDLDGRQNALTEIEDVMRTCDKFIVQLGAPFRTAIEQFLGVHRSEDDPLVHALTRQLDAILEDERRAAEAKLLEEKRRIREGLNRHAADLLLLLPTTIKLDAHRHAIRELWDLASKGSDAAIHGLTQVFKQVGASGRSTIGLIPGKLVKQIGADGVIEMVHSWNLSLLELMGVLRGLDLDMSTALSESKTFRSEISRLPAEDLGRIATVTKQEPLARYVREIATESAVSHLREVIKKSDSDSPQSCAEVLAEVDLCATRLATLAGPRNAHAEVWRVFDRITVDFRAAVRKCLIDFEQRVLASPMTVSRSATAVHLESARNLINSLFATPQDSPDYKSMRTLDARLGRIYAAGGPLDTWLQACEAEQSRCSQVAIQLKSNEKILVDRITARNGWFIFSAVWSGAAMVLVIGSTVAEARSILDYGGDLSQLFNGKERIDLLLPFLPTAAFVVVGIRYALKVNSSHKVVRRLRSMGFVTPEYRGGASA